jgi:hypothetical protein
MTKPKEEIKIGDCPIDCKYQDTGHGHCLICGKITEPVMECECDFRKKENWEIEFDKFGDIYATGWGGEKCFCNNAVKSFILKYKSLWQQEAEERISKIEQIRCEEWAFDTLMSCMPKTAENISTITGEDARKMLNDFVKKTLTKNETK